MFLCVSLNPAIDKRLCLPSLYRGQIHRVRTVQSFPGGKATHVAMVLRTLGDAPQWIGPCGGPAGAELITGLSTLGIQAHPFSTVQPTRTNLEIIDDEGTVTEILEPGATLPEADWLAFETSCKHFFSQNQSPAITIFSGSLPAGTSPERYARLIHLAHEFGCHTLLDTSGEPLKVALSARPQFVKPNRDEAAQILGMRIDSPSSAARALRRILERGAQSAALSLGAEGLVFCAAENAPVLFAVSPTLQPRSTVGCGDSALAGFAHAFASRATPEQSLRLAAACASANCFAEHPGAARLEHIRQFEGEIRVRILDEGSAGQ